MKYQSRKKCFLTWAAGLFAAIAICGIAAAQSADSLIDKLVKKGILTEQEAKEMRADSDRDFYNALKSKTGMPDWVTSFTWKGDLRTRLDLTRSTDEPNSNAKFERTRFNYRFRYGALVKIKSDIEIGFRLGSGVSGQPLSLNQTFGNNADKKPLFLDMAYAKWQLVDGPVFGMNLIAGKMENPFTSKSLKLSDSIFDTNYTPEGIGAEGRFNISTNHSLAFGTGVFIVDENSASIADARLLVYGLKLNSTWSPKWNSAFGVGGYFLQNSDAIADNNSSNGFVGTGNTSSTMNHRPVVADGMISYLMDSFPMYKGAFPVALTGEYIKNPAASSQNEGASFGVLLGKSGKKGLWDLSWRYKQIEADAVWDDISDLDYGAWNESSPRTYAGGTDIRGHVFHFQYNFTDAWILSAKYYLTERISAARELDSHRIQIDVSWKF